MTRWDKGWLERAAEQSYAADNDRGGAPLSWLAAVVVNENTAIERYGRAAWDAAYARAAFYANPPEVVQDEG